MTIAAHAAKTMPPAAHARFCGLVVTASPLSVWIRPM